MKSILDVSNIVYGGYYGSPSYRMHGFPVGGIRKLLGIINAEIRNSEFALAFDGGATIKKELLPQYKAGRVPNYAVMAQLDLLRDILLDCNIPFYHELTWEGDDIICALVDTLAIVRDPDNIVIYSDDRDMACCVSDTVSIRNVTINGIRITRSNYEERVVSGERIPFNTILLHKMIYGDRSDNYPGLKIPGLRFDELALAYTNIVEDMIQNGTLLSTAYMDYDVCTAIIDSLDSNIGNDVKQRLKEQARIVFPQMVDLTSHGMPALFADIEKNTDPLFKVVKRHLKIFGYGDFDRNKFDFYCGAFGLNRCRPDRYNSSYIEMSDKLNATLATLAKDLASGALAVEKYQKRKVVQPRSASIDNMQLPI